MVSNGNRWKFLTDTFLDRLQRIFSALLIVGGVGHGVFGTLFMSPLTDQLTLWSFSGSLAIWLLGLFSWLQVKRRGDRAISVILALGHLCWAGLMIWLMLIRDDMWLDVRPVGFIIIGAGLAIMVMRGSHKALGQ